VIDVTNGEPTEEAAPELTDPVEATEEEAATEEPSEDA
jgi:hypothetical protein